MGGGFRDVDWVSGLCHAANKPATGGQTAVADRLLVETVTGHQHHGAIRRGDVKTAHVHGNGTMDGFDNQLDLVFSLVRLGGGLHNAGQFLQRIH